MTIWVVYEDNSREWDPGFAGIRKAFRDEASAKMYIALQKHPEEFYYEATELDNAEVVG